MCQQDAVTCNNTLMFLHTHKCFLHRVIMPTVTKSPKVYVLVPYSKESFEMKDMKDSKERASVFCHQLFVQLSWDLPWAVSWWRFSVIVLIRISFIPRKHTFRPPVDTQATLYFRVPVRRWLTLVAIPFSWWIPDSCTHVVFINLMKVYCKCCGILSQNRALVETHCWIFRCFPCCSSRFVRNGTTRRVRRALRRARRSLVRR